MILPASFVQTIRNTFGEAGASWLDRLPALLAESAERWSLTLAPAVSNLSYNYVAPATRADGTPVMLKLGVPNPELLTEIAALEHYAGRGICQLLAADRERGMLLLERLQPGDMLSSLANDGGNADANDDRATTIAAQVMLALWRPAPAEHNFPTVAGWGQGLERLRQRFAGGVGPFPARLVEQAERIFAELLTSSGDQPGQQLLLHGDLHHYNILAGRGGWLAIDPKGLVGEAAYETGALLRNEWGADLATLPQRTARRVAILAEVLNQDRQRIIGWGIAQAVLSAWWDYEDNGDSWASQFILAEVLAGVVG
jgi:streptomycin 6-kinase